MPVFYARTFKIRHCECESGGILRRSGLLRFMQESAYEASEEKGYGMTHYDQTGKVWYVLETEIEFLAPIYYGQEVVVKTWVEDFHRARSIRAYEVYLKGRNVLAARAWTDWVYVDRTSQQPCRVPQDMIRAFLPEWQKGNSLARERLAAPRKNAEQSFVDLRRVERRDLDPVDHVNNAVYYDYVEECLYKADLAFGWSSEHLEELGYRLQTRRARLDYRQPAEYGDELEISTWIYDLQEDRWTRFFQVRNSQDQSLVMQAHLQQVAFNRTTNQPACFPEEVLRGYAANIARRDYDRSDPTI